MEPNQQTPLVNQPTTPVTTSPINNPENKPNNSHKLLFLLLGVFIILILIGGIGGGYLLYAGKSQTKQLITNASSPTIQQASPTSVITPTTDSTTNWKTYTNSKYGFTFQYPEDWASLEAQSQSEATNTFNFGVINTKSPDGKPITPYIGNGILLTIKPETVLTDANKLALVDIETIENLQWKDVIIAGVKTQQVEYGCQSVCSVTLFQHKNAVFVFQGSNVDLIEMNKVLNTIRLIN